MAMNRNLITRGNDMSASPAGEFRALALLFATVLLHACAPDDGGAHRVANAQATSDTAVHQAEVSAGQLDEIMARGEEVYLANCGTCHQPSGEGLGNAFPPLANSDYLEQHDRKDLLKTALFGLSGPIMVNGKEYNGVMPSMGYLTDQQLADALTYVFNSWGNDLAAVSPDEVAALRVEEGSLARAGEQPHVGTSETEIRYRGTPSPIEAGSTREVQTSE